MTYFHHELIKDKNIVVCLDLSFGAGLTAHRADQVTAVHLNYVIIKTKYSLVPRAGNDVVVNTRRHALEIHNLIPDGRDKEG